MEVEAKFIVPDAATARTLAKLQTVGDFTLGAAERLRMRDTFYDTPDHALLQARVVLRVRRRSDGKTIVTVKTPAERRGAIHRRPETEAEANLPRGTGALSPRELPRRVAQALAPYLDSSELAPMFSITQTRQVRRVKSGSRVIAEWSLDRVTFSSAMRQTSFHELEIELKHKGNDAQLQAMVKSLQRAFQLKPQAKSKFQRAVEFSRAQKSGA